MLYGNSVLWSSINEQVIPLAPSPASESSGNLIDSILNATLGATSGRDATIKFKVQEEYITLQGDQNEALVLTDLTQKVGSTRPRCFGPPIQKYLSLSIYLCSASVTIMVD